MRYILIILVFLSVGANAQMIIKAHANYRPLVQPAGNLLLDDYPNAAAAYSLRKLDKDYTGAAIRVRKDTTGQPEQDIGFTANGDLDTASLKSFLNAHSGFVTTWYSQGDSTSVNFAQSTQANQPRIALNGVIERRLGEPSIFFDGTNDFMQVASSTVKFNYLHKSGQSAIFLVHQVGIVSNPNVLYFLLDNTDANVNSIGINLAYDDRLSISRNDAIESGILRGSSPPVSVQSPNNFYTPNVLGLLTNLVDNSTATAANRNILYFNGGNEQKLNTSTGAASTSNASFNMTLGRRANATQFELRGYVSEIIFYSTNQSSNRTGIESNINTYYGIY